ncbi:MAG: histidine kinase, partial [Clostridia bacterium]|nr:histidine kinase [Clostridia bacterium]
MHDYSAIDKIFRETIDTIRNGQERMFNIAETAREEYIRVKKDFAEVKDRTAEVIKKVDVFEGKNKLVRRRLAEVSRNFDRFSEADIKDAYENVKDIQVKLVLLREQEKQLRERRTELEMRCRNLSQMAEKAEEMVSHVGVAIDFLTSNLENIWGEMEKAQLREKTIFAIIKAQEEERLRIARDIHDGPAQSLVNMVMQAEYCQRLLEMRPGDVNTELEV